MENKTVKLNMLEPRATEKTYTEQTKRIYVFPVDRGMSKQAIAKRVEEEFNVKVTDVRVLIRKGKKTKFSRGKHAYPGTTHRMDKKFAYVKLAEGNSIKVFEEVEDEKDNKTSAKEAKKAEKEAKKAEKEAKKADKNAGKENK